MEGTNKQIGALRLSGLMIGPILGSGVILLPPLAYAKLGTASIWAWLIIMGLGAIFALIFSKLTIAYPGDGGMTVAIDRVLGKRFKIYASLLMMTAVSFGPTAVMLTATAYLKELGVFKSLPETGIAMLLVLICFGLLTTEIKFISTLSLVSSVVIGVVLTFSSAVTLLQNGIHVDLVSVQAMPELEQTVLLLFWAIIGWEIVGNYALQVKDLKKTIPMATTLSLVAVTVIYLIIALAFQSFEGAESLTMVEVLMPVFGSFSPLVLALLITALCLATYLLIVGALARLVYDLAADKVLPKWFLYKNKNDVPLRGVMYFTLAHLTVLSLYQLGLLNLEVIVTIANGFFLANALIGLVASFGIVKGWLFKIGAGALILSLTALLLLSSPWIWLIMLIEIIMVWRLNIVK